MSMDNALVVYKKSVYQIYVLERRNPSILKQLRRNETLKSLKAAHEAHERTLRKVENVLREKKIPHRIIYRASTFDYRPYDFVISVGGDGTFLEAARGIRRQAILGINSDPERSVGSFCSANEDNFDEVLGRMLEGRARFVKLHSMQMKINGKRLHFSALNDLLISHPNPAAMSRYWIQIGNVRETHASSGVWIATAAGSTGAMKSAGGKVMPRGTKGLQYRPRELYRRSGSRYRLTGGRIPSGRRIRLGSLMREGIIYVDGSHLRIPFRFGDMLELSESSYPLHVITSGSRHW